VLPPHAPLEGSFHVWPWGSLDNRPRGLSHATPLGRCYVTGHDPSPAHAGGSWQTKQGVSPLTPGAPDERLMVSHADRGLRCHIHPGACGFASRPGAMVSAF